MNENEVSKSEVERRYEELLTPAAKELVDLKFKLTKAQRSLIKEYEGKTWSNDHYDFFIKCIELLRRRSELIEEMKSIHVRPPLEVETLEEEEPVSIEESPVVQDIYHLLEPAARELVTEKKVGHIDRAVKPYKKRRR